MKLQIEVSPGELVDRTSILALKKKHIVDPDKQKIVAEELLSLTAKMGPEFQSETILIKAGQLLEVNSSLWEVEDALRMLEGKKQFDFEFIALARSVYALNDRRAQLKRLINGLIGGDTVQEVKHYAGSTAVAG